MKLLSVFFKLGVLDFRREVVYVFLTFLQLLFCPVLLNNIHEFHKWFDVGTVFLAYDFVGREGYFFVEDRLLNWVESDIFFI